MLIICLKADLDPSNRRIWYIKRIRMTEMKSAKAKAMVKLIEQEHRLMQKVR